MDKKKLLLVAVSAGAVLLIVIAIPLFFITPSQNVRSAHTGVYQETYRQVEIIPHAFLESENPVPVNPFAPPQITQPVQTETTPADSSRVTTIDIPVPHTVAVPRVSDLRTPARPVQPRQPAAVAAREPAAARPATPAVTASRAAAVDTSKTQSDYWVQAGAFSTKIRAEGVKESLENKGIKSIIVNQDIEGKTWYRVRVGPYTTESEAKYWLALVQAIDGFGESQVRQTTALR